MSDPYISLNCCLTSTNSSSDTCPLSIISFIIPSVCFSSSGLISPSMPGKPIPPAPPIAFIISSIPSIPSMPSSPPIMPSRPSPPSFIKFIIIFIICFCISPSAFLSVMAKTSCNVSTRSCDVPPPAKASSDIIDEPA